MTLPVWPLSTPYLANGNAYTYKPDVAFARSDYDAGPARQRKRFTDSTVQLNFAVTMQADEFERFKYFYKNEIFEGSSWFTFNAYTGNNYTSSTARFVQPFSAVDVSPDHFVVTCPVELRGIIVMSGGTAWFMDTYGLSDTALYGAIDSLDTVTNSNSAEPGYPFATRNRDWISP